MDNHQRTDLVLEAISRLVDGDAEGAGRAMDALGENSDGHEMFAVCCAFATSATYMLRRIYGNQWRKGEPLVLEEVRPGALLEDPAEAFALRFLTAYANEDWDNCLALYAVASKAGDENYTHSVMVLLKETAAITKLAIEEAKI